MDTENKLFYSMIKDTKEQFEEFCSLMKYVDDEKKDCFEVFVCNLRTVLDISQK